MAKTKILSTQDFLSFETIKEGVIILKDKSLRAVLITSSLNFALKDEEEQNLILNQFQNFLNGLDFSCQILVQSRKLNFTGYLDQLKELEKKENNNLLKRQIQEYYKFINNLIEENAIMQKSFYLIVPFSLLEMKGVSSLELSKKIIEKKEALSPEDFERAKTQLFQRCEFVILGLRQLGINAALLTTPELIELLWALHHPLEAEKGYFPEIPPHLAEQ